MTKIATVVVNTPLCGANTGANKLTAHFNFSETQINVRCVDERTGQEKIAQLQFDSTEVLGDTGVCAA
jgi:hypothetical protein